MLILTLKKEPSNIRVCGLEIFYPKSNKILNLNKIIMEINWLIISAIVVGVALLVYFLIRQNKKDRKKIEEELNYTPESEEVEINNDLNL